MKKNRNLINSLKLAGLMSMMTLAGCCYNCGCRDCGCHDCDKQKTEKVTPCPEHDTIFVVIDRSCPKHKPKPKPIVKPEPEPVKPDPVKPEPKPEPEPEENCVTTTKTTRTRVIISGDADDVTRAAIMILNGNCR